MYFDMLLLSAYIVIQKSYYSVKLAVILVVMDVGSFEQNIRMALAATLHISMCYLLTLA